MALDDALRAAIRTRVQLARGILTEDLAKTLEATYGIHRSGQVEAADGLPRLREDSRARETRDLLGRLLPDPTASSSKPRVAVVIDELVRELAFTHLNRLVAFKMMEHPSRKIIRESVGHGQESRAFKFYLADRPEEEASARSGLGDDVYERFLLWQCGQLDKEIGVLFDPNDLASRIFPSPRALAAVLELINDEALGAAWPHEETVGWFYQFYTPEEQRRAARKQSHDPRNSYEMAFRNQFYTPDYVVRFLTENTLGRLWLEMKPDTALREKAEYLVIRPDEIPRRRIGRDPREIRIIDPACGSGHFLLYAFELLETIYSEAYDDAALGVSLRADFPDREAFVRAVPGLIIEQNLHGIDIDRRASQLALLALFLKAKTRSHDVLIERSNVVCAEPMPGDQAQLDDFKRRKLPNGHGVLARILDGVWKHMELAGDAGSLLLAEQTVQALVAKEHEAWRERNSHGIFQDVLPFLPAAPRQLRLDFSDVTDADFWESAEERVEQLLDEYAREAVGAEGLHRHLFAKDGIAGLRFIDVLRQEYDVVLMNPPFGEPSAPSKAYIDTHYPRTRNDVYAAFVERWLDRMTPHGRLGAITSRTGFFLKSFAKWRKEILLTQTNIELVADLGVGVLDTAMVEVAAYVLEKLPKESWKVEEPVASAAL